MGFRWSEVQILSPRPTSLSGDRIPGPVSSLPPGVRRVKLSRGAFLLHSEVRGRPSVVCPFDGAVIHWITANTPSHPQDILLFPPHPLAPTNLRRFASCSTCKSRTGLATFRLPAALASPGQTFRGLPVRRGSDSLDHRQYSISP